ncbi:hypothetical protein EAL2_c07900 [Peptoclostridium acidaminophilum DSM 3953]|uniref:2-dehydropantoate 2-reductase n=1 Tax=Peptoclostridium acidaminophilum DSM 3953 TaxID=1286171 RepID=W8T5F7_PEPAC|nr:2-dehydropantoate 2-reductase N-terminal domain-containing protein [Peptoclostridium acidaminophilum]AHM56090.1 hypothetical protein EAL2_c07900 [Peptoclostridium acidaminophilum DSM 3953]
MKYLVIGAGGTGASIGGFLAYKGKDVTFIARGEHLKALRQNGLLLHSGRIGEVKIENVKACIADDLLADHLKILDGFTPDTTASLQKDLDAKKESEVDQIIFDIIRMSEKYNVDMPVYREIALHFGYKS